MARPTATGQTADSASPTFCATQFAERIPGATFRGRIAVPAVTRAPGRHTAPRKILCPNGLQLSRWGRIKMQQQCARKWTRYLRPTNNELRLTIG